MEDGDLVFSFIGRADNAISAVTEGFRGARVNHVGVLVRNNLGVFVLEAFPPEVRLTNLAVFLRRAEDSSGQARYMVGRLRSQYRGLIPAALAYGLQQRDTPYDRLYLTDASELYCSELIVDMFKVANQGVDVFTEQPMSFRDRATGELSPQWIAYYEYFGMPVPQGEPGSNPGGISSDPKLGIYEVNGQIPGFVAP